MPTATKDERQLPTFISKTYDMVRCETNASIIDWNNGGNGFIIRDEHEFANKVLPSYFKHKNISSFVRQLNLYGFHKISKDAEFMEFQHDNFLRDKPERMHDIVRKQATPKAASPSKETMEGLRQQIRDLKKQYKQMLKVQQQMMLFMASFAKEYAPNRSLPFPPNSLFIEFENSLSPDRHTKRQKTDGSVNFDWLETDEPATSPMSNDAAAVSPPLPQHGHVLPSEDAMSGGKRTS